MQDATEFAESWGFSILGGEMSVVGMDLSVVLLLSLDFIWNAKRYVSRLPLDTPIVQLFSILFGTLRELSL
ncbi:MAG: hypothetical protein ACRC3B_14520 [Bacteroidia bacterium]